MRLIFAAMATCSILFAADASHAVVLDFESLQHVDADFVNHGSEYEEDGFRVTTPVGNLLSYGTLAASFSGSTAIFNGFLDGRQQIASIDGAPFTLVSIDLTELNPFPPPGPTVIFTGQLDSGGTVMQSFTLDGVHPEPETFFFDSAFQGLIAVEFRASSPTTDEAFQYDNIQTTVTAPAVPSIHPIPLYTLVPGLLVGVGLVAMRRRE